MPYFRAHGRALWRMSDCVENDMDRGRTAHKGVPELRHAFVRGTKFSAICHLVAVHRSPESPGGG